MPFRPLPPGPYASEEERTTWFNDHARYFGENDYRIPDFNGDRIRAKTPRKLRKKFDKAWMRLAEGRAKAISFSVAGRRDRRAARGDID